MGSARVNFWLALPSVRLIATGIDSISSAILPLNSSTVLYMNPASPPWYGNCGVGSRSYSENT